MDAGALGGDNARERPQKEETKAGGMMEWEVKFEEVLTWLRNAMEQSEGQTQYSNSSGHDKVQLSR